MLKRWGGRPGDRKLYVALTGRLIKHFDRQDRISGKDIEIGSEHVVGDLGAQGHVRHHQPQAEMLLDRAEDEDIGKVAALQPRTDIGREVRGFPGFGTRCP